MARPRKHEGEQATVKIEGAFWRLLETEGNSSITVLRLSQESGTNRNSFYYHYRDINDLADQAFRRMADSEASEVLLAGLLKKTDPKNLSMEEKEPLLMLQAKRIMLCAGSDSGILNRLVYDLLKETWLKELSISEEALSPTEKLQIHFIFFGLVAVLGSPEVRKKPLFMLSLAQTDMGRMAIDSLKTISERQKSRVPAPEREIRTERMLLRPFSRDDLDLIQTLYGDEEILKYTPIDTVTPQEAEEKLSRFVQDWEKEPLESMEFAMVRLGSAPEKIGRCHILIDPQTDTGMIGWLIRKEFQGQGLAVESGKALIRYCFDVLGIHRVNAVCNPENQASQKALEKCGMRREAHYRKKCRYTKNGRTIWVDELEYAILIEEIQK